MWKGTQKASDHALLDTPVAITSFVSEATSPRLPSLAVAAGSHIYIYRNLRPYYKFALPPEDVNTEEQDVWCACMHACSTWVLHESSADHNGCHHFMYGGHDVLDKLCVDLTLGAKVCACMKNKSGQYWYCHAACT